MSQPDYLNPAENPIARGAGQIRTITESLVNTDLEGNFPKNFQWHHGDYNCLFVADQSWGRQYGSFPGGAHLVVLDSDGRYKAGDVSLYVGNDHSYWKIDKPKLAPATDVEVVRFGPKLVSDLFVQVGREVLE